MATDASGMHLYLTLDDDDENAVLELVRVDASGMYIRDNSRWVEINPDDDNARVWDRQIVDVTTDAVESFDEAERRGIITRDLFTSFEISDEDAA